MATKKIAQTVITEDKFYTIAAANGKVVEVKDYNTENGAQIQLWDNANAEWQQWSFVRAGEGVYRIKNRKDQVQPGRQVPGPGQHEHRKRCSPADLGRCERR